MGHRSREIRLAARPRGFPGPECFELAEAELPEPEGGQLLVRNALMSVDPYMRGRMDDRPSYVPPFRLGKPLQGGAVGQVVASGAEGLAAGDWVSHQLGWRELALVKAEHAEPVDPEAAPLGAQLGVLGMPGFTAWVGLHEIAAAKEGETVFVSAASGAVGSVAGQLARHMGCRVIGSAGSAEKVQWLTAELGFDAAFDYREHDPAEALAAHAPKGIDVYFDNVGGPQLEAAIGALRPFGRIALCGMISRYNDPEPAPGPSNMVQLVGKRALLRGFIVTDHYDRLGEFRERIAPLVASGELRYRETVRDGIERAPEAFLELLRGDKIGKMLVKVGPAPDETG